MAKTELEEAGLETDGMVESTAKLRQEILALSGVDIMENENTFKSTYKIMDELAAKWEDLTDIQQASITELIAGKRQGNIVSSLMSNFDTARKALETSINSEGSAMAEHEKWMQSVEASVNKVKAAWQSLSQSFLKSDFLKGLLGSVSTLADGLAKLLDTFGTLPTLATLFVGGMSIFKKGGFFKVIEDDASRFGMKMTTIFGQTANSVNASLSTINVRNGFSKTLDPNDIAAIRNYSNAVQHGVSSTTAFRNCMGEASDAAKAYVQNTDASAVSTSGFVAQQQAAEVSTLAQNKSLGSANALMKEYHSGCKTTGMAQTDFANAVKQTNPQLAAAMTTTNSSVGGMIKYTASLVGAKVASFALQAATMALNMALTMGISLLVSGLFSAISKVINAEKDLAEKVEEVTSKFKEQHDELKKLESDYDTSNEDSMISKYEKLSKGVDNLGRNVSLTADEYSEYQSIVNKIAEQIPSLVSGYDSQGNALLSCKGNVEELTAAYEKLIHTQNQQILTSTGNIEKDFANTLEKSSGKHWWSDGHGFWAPFFTSISQHSINDSYAAPFFDYELKGDTIRGMQNLLNVESGSERKKILDKLRADRFSPEEIRDALTDAGVDISYFESPIDALEKTLEDDPQKVKNIIDNYYAQFAEAVEKEKTIATAKLSEAFDVSSALSGLNYGNISEDLQAIAYQTVSSLDFDFFTELSESGKTVEQWTTEMLDQLNSISKADNKEIEAAFDLQTQFNGGEISYGEYVKGLEDTGKLIERLNLKPELESQLKLSLGLDEDGLVEGYKVLKNKLANNEKFDIMPSEYKSFLDGLSAEEVSVLIDIIPELQESDYKESIEDVKSALRREMIIQGLTFDLNLEVESTGIEALNTALAESVSATGLSSESITALKGRYSELESQGYDLSSMFEETSNGIHINRNELNKLEKAYASQKLDEVNGDLAEMKAEYDRLGEELKTCGDEAKAGIYNDRLTLAQKISEAATLAAQYEGLTSAYNDWLSAEEAGQERDMYEKVIEGFENVDDEISRGWIDDGTIKFLELLTGQTDLAGKSGKQLKEIYDGLDDTIKNTTYSVRDFFTVDEDGNSTNTGVYNFLDAISQLEKTNVKSSVLDKTFKEIEGIENLIKKDENGNIISFDFGIVGGDKAIADALGISEELVQIMLRAADDAGFVISMDGAYRQLADLQNEAKAAADYLHEIGKTDFEFDFNTTSVENLKTQLEEAHKILDDKSFWNKDGTFNFNADGATQAMQIVSTLQAKLDNLTSEKYGIGLTVEDEEFKEPLENLQDYGHKIAALNQLELNPKANADEIEKVNDELNEIAEYFANLDDNKKIELGFEADDGVEEVKKKIESGEIKIPTVLDIQTNMDKNIETLADLALLNSGLLSDSEEEIIKKKYSVDVEIEGGEVDTSDVDNKVNGALNGDVSTHDSSSGVLHRSSGKKFELTREANIQIIAETFGVNDVDDLSSKIKGLDDKTVQAIAEAIGQIDVDALRQEIAKLEPTKVEAIAEAIGEGDVKGLKTAVNNLEPKQVDAIAKALGYDDVDQLNTAIESMDGNTVQAVAQALGITDVQSLQTVIDNMQGNTVDAKVNTDGQASKIYTLQDIIDKLKGKTVDIVINTFKNIIETVSSGGKKKAAQRTGANPDGKGGVNGTANVNGTTGRAFKQGSWGTKNSGAALVGELGVETLVRDGRYYTIGDSGAEFIKYKKGDIIFNHKQTEELFANGKVTSGGGRGKALASGTAFSKGTGAGLGAVVGGIAVKTKETTKIKETTKTKETTTSTTSKSSGSSSSKEGIGKAKGKAVSSKSSSKAKAEETKDEFEETIDWVEIALSRIEREIDRLDKKANSSYKSWSERNKALTNEISKVGDEIELQQSAYNRYMKEANSVGLSESYAKKVREGSINIQDFEGENNEALVEKIKKYQDFYEKALDCQDAIDDLREKERELYDQRFENIQTQYDGILAVTEHEKNMLDESISQAEAQGHLVSENYYKALMANERKNQAQLIAERAKMLAELEKQMTTMGEDGKPIIEKGTEAWYERVNAIDEVTLAIEESDTALLEYEQTLQQLDWEVFDLLQEKISNVTEEADFLIELMSNDKLYDDNGNLTDEGMATMGLHGQNYNTYMHQADKYGAEAARLDAEIAKDPYDQELIARRDEMLELQRESILAAEDEKQAIVDLVEEGINVELDALQERIDKYNESLDAAKDLYDYNRRVKEQTKEIASLEKQMAAYAGDGSEESKAKIQELKVALEDAKADLEETEYDKYISDQKQLLDELYLQYETVLNQRLDNIDVLVAEVVAEVNMNAATISATISEESANVGYTLSEEMRSIWNENAVATQNVITTYGENFSDAQTTTNQTLGRIEMSVQNMVSHLNAEAARKSAEAAKSSAANPPQTNTKPPASAKPAKPATTSGGDGKPKVGDKVKFISGKYYYDSEGKSPAGSQNKGKEVYITSINTKSWATHPYHISTGKKLGSGDLGWLKLSQISGYATGKKNISNSKYAWTQEKGREFIIRPSDGAILTPVAKGDSVLNAAASGNIWNMANSPAEFIKDNLNLGAANVPNNSNVQNSYTQHLDKVVINLPNVKNYDEFLSSLQKDKNFERLIESMSIGKLAGGSSLAKGKAIR